MDGETYYPPPGYQLVEVVTGYKLPKDWKVLESEKGRRVYETPPPRVKIRCRKELTDLQRSGKYKEI